MTLFETQRLSVRELEVDDIPYIYAYGKEPIVVQYQDWGPVSLENSEHFYFRSQQDRTSEVRSNYTLGVILQSSGLLIGDCGYHFLDKTHSSAEIGYNLHPTYWGKGYGTELVIDLVAYMLSKHEKLMIYAECDSRNMGSRRVLEKSGFELLEIRKDDVVQKEVLINTCKYGLDKNRMINNTAN